MLNQGQLYGVQGATAPTQMSAAFPTGPNEMYFSTNVFVNYECQQKPFIEKDATNAHQTI